MTATYDIGAIEYQGTTPPPVNLVCPKGQFLAQYFNNVDLAGVPVFSRCEPGINYDWGTGGPGNGINSDGFSVRWAGVFTFTAGTFQFEVTVDDGIRLWLDGNLIIDQWKDQAATYYTINKVVLAGDHTIKVEYYEGGGAASVKVGWKLVSTPTPVPPDPTPVPPAPTTMELYVDGVFQVKGPVDQPLSYKINTNKKTKTITVVSK